jgi:signal peptidase I
MSERTAARRPNRRIRRLLGLAALLTVACYLFPMRLGVVCGESMSPALHNGQVFLMHRTRHPRPPRRGDIVVIDVNGEKEIKRVYAIPGDTVRGIDWPETPGRPSYIADEREMTVLPQLLRRRPAIGRLVSVTVPRDHIFVLGDATARSYDSRHFGPVPVRAITGNLVASLFVVPTQGSPYERAMASEVAETRRK